MSWWPLLTNHNSLLTFNFYLNWPNKTYWDRCCFPLTLWGKKRKRKSSSFSYIFFIFLIVNCHIMLYDIPLKLVTSLLIWHFCIVIFEPYTFLNNKSYKSCRTILSSYHCFLAISRCPRKYAMAYRLVAYFLRKVIIHKFLTTSSI